MIGAATINGTNGLFQIAADGSGAVTRLNIITPGDPVAYVGAVLTEGLPRLTAWGTSTNTVVVSWPSPSTGFTLQQNTNISTTDWVGIPQTVTDDGTNKFIIVNPPTGKRFYRLVK